MRRPPLSCLESGPRDAPPVLLVHGFPLDGRMWGTVARLLAQRWRTLVPDLRGFGTSPPGPERWALEDCAGDLEELLQSCGAVPCAAVGFSMGGYAVLALAERAPAAICGVALVDSRAEADGEQARRDRTAAAARVGSEGTAWLVEEMLPRLLDPANLEGNPRLSDEVRRLMAVQPAASVRAAILAMRDRPSRVSAVERLDGPFQVMAGSADVLTPPDEGRALAARAPQGEFHEIQGAGHLAPLERPGDVAAHLEAFLSRVFGRGPKA
ncbi:MAG: alpha/beta fold hydrolase [Acidobacteriota bacterium]